MNCPECGGETEVYESRRGGCVGTAKPKPQLVYRRRQCLSCAHRFTTHEKPVGNAVGLCALRQLASDMDSALLRYESASADESRTLGRALILMDQVRASLEEAYAHSAKSELLNLGAPRKGRR
jgi:transcriptional regulator NrdR family protein